MQLRKEVRAVESGFCDSEVIHAEAVDEVRKKMTGDGEYQSLAALYKMFGDPSRLRILHALSLRELCVCDLAALLGLSKSAVSHQLKALRLGKLVKFRREGQVVFYSLDDDHVKDILALGFEHLREE